MKPVIARVALAVLTISSLGMIWIVYLIAKVLEDVGGWLLDFVKDPWRERYPFMSVMLDGLTGTAYIVVYYVSLKFVIDWCLETLGWKQRRQRHIVDN